MYLRNDVMTNQLINNLLKLHIGRIMFLLIGLSIFINFGINSLFLTESIYYQSFADRVANNRIIQVIEILHRFQWLGYLFIPIIIITRISFTTICLYVGLFFSELRVEFRDLMKATLLSDFVFLLALLIKLIILIFFKEVNVLEDLQFQPFSLMDFFDKKTGDVLFFYPLSLLNAFELLYWLVLAWLLTGVVEKPMSSTLKTVATSYGSGLLLWVLFVMFLTVNLT